MEEEEGTDPRQLTSGCTHRGTPGERNGAGGAQIRAAKRETHLCFKGRARGAGQKAQNETRAIPEPKRRGRMPEATSSASVCATRDLARTDVVPQFLVVTTDTFSSYVHACGSSGAEQLITSFNTRSKTSVQRSSRNKTLTSLSGILR